MINKIKLLIVNMNKHRSLLLIAMPSLILLLIHTITVSINFILLTIICLVFLCSIVVSIIKTNKTISSTIRYRLLKTITKLLQESHGS